ncbi:MAG: S9 family peptidase [Actinobacteria bacterium]|nr:S9 family peptidase [Actinomycetota bacterium]
MSHRSIAETIIGSVVQASAPAVSPDGSLIAFVVTRTDLDDNTYKSQVWLTSADGVTAPHPITGGEHDGQPAWSSDGTSLAFTSRRGEKDSETTLHVLPIGRAGEIRTVATMPDGIGTPRFSPDGQHVAFTSRTRDARYDAKDERWQAPRKIERFFSRLDNEGWIFDRPQHVYVVRSDGSTPPRNLTPGEFQHDGIAWTPDSSSIVTSAQRHDTWDLDFASDLYVVGLDGTIRALTSQTGVYSNPSVSPDGTTVAFLGMDDSSTYPQNVHVAVVPTAGGPHRFLSRALDRTFQPTAGFRPPVWTSPTTLLVTAEDRGQTHVFRVDTEGAAPTPMTTGAITVKAFDAAAGTVAATIGSVDGVADLFVIDAEAPRRVTDFAPRYAHAARPQTWERIAVPTTDGTAEIDAWVMRPADFDPARTYPVIVNVHGGPHTQYGETMFDEAQFQSAAGFVVVMCNPRGSSGREQAWGQSIMGPKHPTAPGSGWGSVDVDDVLAVLDHVLTTLPFCDPERVGMQGGSYGGFMATWLAGHHGSRFRAICSERAVNNMLSEEWSSDIGSSFRVEHGPSHLDDPDAYVSISPMQRVRDIEVPMLLLHSEDDLRCPISQAEELFMALRLLGRDVTFYRFPGEGHELSRSGSPVHRVQRAEIILDFFAEKLAPSP